MCRYLLDDPTAALCICDSLKLAIARREDRQGDLSRQMVLPRSALPCSDLPSN